MLDLEAREQRDLVLVELELLERLRRDLLHELLHALVDLGVVHEDLADVRAQVIADRAHDEVRFLVDQERRRALGRGLADRIPQRDQVIAVPLELFRRAADARGAGDDRVVLGQLQLGQGLAQFRAFLALDASGDASATGVVRHEHEVAAGEADEGGKRRALGAALLLVHLDDELLALPDDVLDAHLAHGGAFVVALETDARDFLQRQEPLALGTVVDEGRLERGLDAGDLPLVDVAFLLLVGGGLDIEVEEFLAIDDRQAQLLGVSCVEQNTFH